MIAKGFGGSVELRADGIQILPSRILGAGKRPKFIPLSDIREVKLIDGSFLSMPCIHFVQIGRPTLHGRGLEKDENSQPFDLQQKRAFSELKACVDSARALLPLRAEQTAPQQGSVETGKRDAEQSAPISKTGLLIVITVIGFFVAAVVSGSAPGDGDRTSVREATCNGDINCAGSNVQSRASRECGRVLETLAKYDFKWTDGWTDSRLPRAKWSERYDILERFGPQRIIEFQGNALQLQNGFGAYQRVSYECDYDPTTLTVVDVRLDGAR